MKKFFLIVILSLFLLNCSNDTRKGEKEKLIQAKSEIKKTNFKRKDIENLMNNKYAKFFIYHFLFINSEINETLEEERIEIKAKFLEKYLKHPENFKQLLRDFWGFPLTFAELERQYFEVSGKLEKMGISFEKEDYLK